MNQEIILEVTNLSKKIGNTTIIHDLSFQLKKGEIKGLLGPNGSGKTTILKMIVGLLKPTSGSVKINHIDLHNNFSKAIANIGAIIENPELYEYLSGYDNLLQFYRLSPYCSKNRVEEVIQLLEMEDYIDDKVRTYSLGMLQRLGLAQALLHHPSLLLLDEPTNGLDPSGIQDLRKHLKKLAKEGVSVIISSHLLAEIEMICDSVIILNDGQLISDEKLEDIQSSGEKGSIYLFRFLEKADLQSLLSGHPLSNRVISLSAKSLSINLTEIEVAELNHLLISNQVKVVGIEKERTSLEDAFLAKVKGEWQ